MATADSVKGKIQGLIDTASETTGESDVDLTTAVGRLIQGYGTGGGGGFKLINKITLEEQTDRVDFTTDSDGNPFELSEVYLFCNTKTYESTVQKLFFLPNGGWVVGDPYLESSRTTSLNEYNWYARHYFHAVYCDGIILSEELPLKGWNTNLSSIAEDGQDIITEVSIACKFAAGCYFTLIGR